MAPDNQSLAEPTPEPTLLALARKHFGALSRAEEELFRAAQEGRVASALPRGEKGNDPAKAAKWTAKRAVRAECISWVCTDPAASALLTYWGLELWGMRIDGMLDLTNAELKFSFRAKQCAFSENISLQDAQLRGFLLLDCRIKSLNAGRAKISGAVLLRAVKADGEVNLIWARIGGELDCVGAQFVNAGGLALNANSARIDGSVFLFYPFMAEGEVNLLGATIGENLDCDGAHLSNAGGLALNANGAKIEGNVFLVHHFKAEGEVNLRGATIGGNLECDGARLSSAKRSALEASGAKIEGNAYLRRGFQAHGRVRLVGATFGGNLQIREASKAKRMILDLRLAQVGTFWDDEKSWPKAENLFLDGFRYERLFEDAPFEARKRKKWLSLQPRHRFWPQPYEQLAAVLRQMGHEPEARQVMVEKNRDRARFTKVFHQSWWWYNVFGRLISYGYAPWRAFSMSVAMILLGTFLFHLGSAHDLISPIKESAYAKAQNGQLIVENGRKKISEEYPTFNAFFYSLESFTPLLKLDQSANWTPNANRSTEISSLHRTLPTGSLLRHYLYFHIASGWLLTSLWVGAITGLVKT